MQKLKHIVFMNLQRLTVIMMILILVFATGLQIFLVQDHERQNAQAVFLQIGQLLKENTAETAAVTEEYRNTCLLNAETIAYIVQRHPDIIGNVEEFRQLAYMMEVDEIHIFDETGRIFTGTHPEYFDFTFDTGEQIGFFRPMMEDKSLRLCQDITPNTAEGKLVQYSALWSADGQFIVQVGMYPAAVLEVTEKNSLSYIFSLLRGNPGVNLYAIDAVTGEILGSTNSGDNGKQMEQIGFRQEDMAKYRRGAHLTVNGVNSYCIFTDMDGTMIGYVIPQDMMYRSISLYTLLLFLCLVLVELMLVFAVLRFTNRYIISSIDRINIKLSAVANGNLDERVDAHNSQEFTELSSYINDMIHSLLASTDKMSFILNRTSLHIGVYEYSDQMKTVRFTEHIPRILGLKRAEMARLASDHRLFQDYIDQLRQNPVAGEENTYRLGGSQDLFVRLDENTSGSEHLGIVMDVTGEVTTRRQIENERDIDPLTGLFNRFGLDRYMAYVFSDEVERGHSAIVMVDSDNLKEVNDLYGHAAGDLYLQRIAEVLASLGTAEQFTARQSGDEFVVLLYGYSSEEALMNDLQKLRHIQKSTVLHLKEGADIPVRFSFGYVLAHDRRDHRAMLAEADRHMYAVKRKRKKALLLNQAGDGNAEG